MLQPHRVGIYPVSMHQLYECGAQIDEAVFQRQSPASIFHSNLPDCKY